VVPVVFGAPAVREELASAALAETDAASMLEAPKTVKSVGAATAAETEDADGVTSALPDVPRPVEIALGLAVEAPMTDTSVGATGVDVSVPDTVEDWVAEAAALVDEALRSVPAVDCCAVSSELVEVLWESGDWDVVAEGELLLLEEPGD